MDMPLTSRDRPFLKPSQIQPIWRWADLAQNLIRSSTPDGASQGQVWKKSTKGFLKYCVYETTRKHNASGALQVGGITTYNVQVYKTFSVTKIYNGLRELLIPSRVQHNCSLTLKSFESFKFMQLMQVCYWNNFSHLTITLRIHVYNLCGTLNNMTQFFLTVI